MADNMGELREYWQQTYNSQNERVVTHIPESQPGERIE